MQALSEAGEAQPLRYIVKIAENALFGVTPASSQRLAKSAKPAGVITPSRPTGR
ncbi:hypothetical protein [Flavisphingomonas formosensis]|uniref:hypothetical protein n=1 Tax=Flavisphingomonas formosensis TaxID=861534 RepID=UPI0012FA77D8|nr:hypothetical protein [Sphingomonas formosensis]